MFSLIIKFYSKSLKLPHFNKWTDAIYSIPCNDCDNEYIGQTKHQFGTRLKEHQKAGFFLQKRKFSFTGAHMPNQPYSWVG